MVQGEKPPMAQTCSQPHGLDLADRLSDVPVRALTSVKRASEDGDEPGDDTRRGEVDLQKNLRDVNEQLVLSMLRSQELAEAAALANAQLALSEMRFRSLVDSIAAIVWSADARGWIRFDPQWHFLTGLEAGEPSSQWDWLQGVHEADHERVRTTWERSIATGCTYECEHRLKLRRGGTIWVQARAVHIPREGQPVLEWMGMMADTTARKIVEEARERFIGVLGHDLRTPLTAIIMSAESLERMDEPEDRVRVTGLIGRCSQRMNRMIADVLDFTRGRLGGGIPLSPTTANFGHACRDSVNELRAAYPAREIVFEASGDLVGVWDVDRISQVVSNLVGNAVQHGVDPVRVKVHREGDELVLVVNNQNAGEPVPVELLPHLFEPFQRGGPDEHTHAGLGLGLYIVGEIVRAHGATIEVTSTAEGGTTFTSRWPRITTLAEVAQRSSPLAAL
jgi:PAS domain S-box-containing protein